MKGYNSVFYAMVMASDVIEPTLKTPFSFFYDNAAQLFCYQCYISTLKC